MEEGKLRLQFFRSALMAVCVVAATFTGCAVNKTNAVQALIKSGTDPMAAHCAIYNSGSHADGPMCAIVALNARDLTKAMMERSPK